MNINTFVHQNNNNSLIMKKIFTARLFALFALSSIISVCHAQPTAQQWNREVVAGWNLGNQFECPAPGQDGESMAIGNPEGSIKAETA